MSDVTSHISQSIDPSPATLQSQIDDLQERVEQINVILQHLVVANFEFSKDMEIIYSSLKDVAISLADPDDLLGYPLNDEPDDDLIN